MNECKVTVFTPTYNRAHTLTRLYLSLKNQTCFDFEWLIVDDGSTDNTSQLVDEFCEEDNPFIIRHFRQDNSGKHVAINQGVDLAKGELFFIVDSDDYLTDNAIQRIIKWESTIADINGFAGVSGNKGYENGGLIGETFSDEYVDATSLERQKYSISGDKSEVFYTDVLRDNKFPVFEGEKFITENVVWYKIASKDLKIRWFNETIYIAEYLEDGLSRNYVQVFAKNPKGYAYSIKQSISLLHYDKKRIDSEYFNYYQIVKKNVSFRDAARYLDIGQLALIKSIAMFYFRTAIRKLKRSNKDDSQ